VPIRWPQTAEAKSLIAEGVLLLAALPFLLFPNFSPFGTLATFCILILVELVPLFFRWRPLPLAQPFDLIFLIWLLFIGLSIVVTADTDLTLSKASGVLLGIALWRYLGRAVKRPFHWYLALVFWGLLGAGFIGLGVLSADWITKNNFIAPLVEQLPNVQLSLPGLEDGAAHPNQIAGTLLFFFPLLWSTLLGFWPSTSLWRRILLLGLSITATAVLILTQSRSGWLAGAASIYSLLLLWTAVLPKSHPQQKRLLSATGVLTVVGIGLFFYIGPERIFSFWQDPAQETALGSFGSLGFRQEVWRWTVVMLQDFPFTGIGLGSFQRVIRRLYPVMVDPGYPITHAHNVYLQTAVDYSLFGLIIYLALIGILLAMLWQTARQLPRWRPFALGFAASLIAYHVYGLGDVLDSKTNLVIWIMYGLITALYQLNTPAKETRARDGLPGTNTPRQLANQ
jgi:putative inorganic carbon (HCO3(-)) transporter